MALLRQCLFITLLYFQQLWLPTTATNGLDVSTAVPESDWQCALNNGYTFAIVRVYQSSGKVDPNGATTIKNARNAGIKYVDGYIFPCYSCGNPAGQVQAAVNNLRSNNAVFGQLWIDVESSSYWSTSTSDNVNFIQSMVNEAKSMGVTIAIYTSESQWQPITGNSAAFASLQLWYAHYDNEANFNDFVAFGGWTKPAMKQYEGNVNLCGFGVDKNWYP